MTKRSERVEQLRAKYGAKGVDRQDGRDGRDVHFSAPLLYAIL